MRTRAVGRRTMALAAIVALGAMVASCGSDDASETSAGGEETTTVAAPGSTVAVGDPSVPGSVAGEAEGVEGGTLTYLQPFPTRGFDPVIGQVSAQFAITNYAIFDALALERSDGEVELRLIEAGDTADGLTWTLHLKEGVTFSDGTPFDADAVKFNWERLADPANAAVGAAAAQTMEAIEVVDARTLSVTLKSANGQFLRTIASNSLAWVGSPTAIQADPAGFNLKPVGAGPYTLTSYTPGAEIVLTKNPTYYTTTYLDQVIVKEIPDETQRLATLQSGGGDVLRTINANTAVAAEDAGFECMTQSPNGGYALFFNLTKAPFDDVNVRRAFAMAMDGPALSDAVYGGARQPVANIFKEGSPFYDAKFDLPKPDAAEAQRLFDEAAEANGGDLTVSLSYAPAFAAEAEWYATKLAGFDHVEVTLDLVESAVYQQRYSSGDVQFGIHSFAALDPDGFSPWFGTGGQGNYIQLSDPAIDQLLADGRAALDDAERVRIYADLQQFELDNVTHAFFLRQQSWECHNDALQGMGADSQFTPNGGMELNGVWVER